MEMSSRQKLRRKVLEPIDIMNQMILADIYRTFHPNTKEYVFFSTSQGTFSKADSVLRQKKQEIQGN
jgi:exonuclease III